LANNAFVMRGAAALPTSLVLRERSCAGRTGRLVRRNRSLIQHPRGYRGEVTNTRECIFTHLVTPPHGHDDTPSLDVCAGASLPRFGARSRDPLKRVDAWDSSLGSSGRGCSLSTVGSCSPSTVGARSLPTVRACSLDQRKIIPAPGLRACRSGGDLHDASAWELPGRAKRDRPPLCQCPPVAPNTISFTRAAYRTHVGEGGADGPRMYGERRARMRSGCYSKSRRYCRFICVSLNVSELAGSAHGSPTKSSRGMRTSK
jgi:hypothetical protein